MVAQQYHTTCACMYTSSFGAEWGEAEYVAGEPHREGPTPPTAAATTATAVTGSCWWNAAPKMR
jgi:hypothetical protein